MRALAAGKHVLCEKPFSHGRAVEQAFPAAERDRARADGGVMWRHGEQTASCSSSCCRSSATLQTMRATFCFRSPTRSTSGSGPRSAVGRCSTSAATASAARGCSPAEPDRVYGEAVVRAASTCGSRACCASRAALVATFALRLHGPARSLEAIGARGPILVPAPWLRPAGELDRERRAGCRRPGGPVPAGARELRRRDPRRGRAAARRAPSRSARRGYSTRCCLGASGTRSSSDRTLRPEPRVADE